MFLSFYFISFPEHWHSCHPYRVPNNLVSDCSSVDDEQVICYKDICHPTWQPDYRRHVWDTRPTLPWHWKEARSVHVTYPKPTRSLANVWALKNATDIFGEMGRYVLEKSGRLHLLPKH